MMTDIKNRLKELAEKSYNENRYTFTDFLSIDQLSQMYEIYNELSYVGITVYGGFKDSERNIVRFGNEKELLYEQEFPIKILKVSPTYKKWADNLSHRDFLGSIMGLGITREKIGDIIIKANEAYICTSEVIASYIMDNLTSVKRTLVTVTICEAIPEGAMPQIEPESFTVSSNRADALIAKAFNLSRDKACELIMLGKLYINGRNITENAKKLKTDDVISLRGYGKIVLLNEGVLTKKDRLRIEIGRYV